MLPIGSDIERQRASARLSELRSRSVSGGLTSEEQHEAARLDQALRAWFGDHPSELDSSPFDDDDLGDPV